MNLRIAKKIQRAAYRPGVLERYSRDQIRRAFLRCWQSPMMLTHHRIDFMTSRCDLRARRFVISRGCAIVEQRGRLHDWVNQESRIVFVPR